MTAQRRPSRGRTPTFNDLVQTDLKSKRYRPVYLLVGEDTLRIETVVAHLRDDLLGPGGTAFNFHVRHGDQSSLEEVLAQAQSFPMLGARQLVWLRGVDACPIEQSTEAALLNYLQDPVEATCLILSAPKLDGRKKWVRTCREKGFLFDFAPPRGGEVAAWVRKAAVRAGLNLEEPLPAVLVDLVGEDLQALKAEIDKLALLAEEGEGPLTRQRLEEVVMQQGNAGPFDLVDSLRPGLPAPALKIWQNLAAWGQRAEELVPLLQWRVRKLALVAALEREGASAKELAALGGVPPWSLSRLLATARAFGPEGLAALLTESHRCEATMKRSAIPAVMALERALFGLAGSSDSPPGG